MAVQWEWWHRSVVHPGELELVRAIATKLYQRLREPAVQTAIDSVNKPGVHSARIQAEVLAHAAEVEFHSERRGLFSEYNTPGLRPDYYRPLPEYSTGIIFEVERGKATINNMDLLDLWKCHICAEAHHLFLLVPQVLQQNEDDPRVTRPFDYVRKRLPSFFESGNYTNVRSCWLYGY